MGGSQRNGLDGITAGFDCLVQRNTVRANTGYGLDLSNDAAYRENVIISNTAGTVDELVSEATTPMPLAYTDCGRMKPCRTFVHLKTDTNRTRKKLEFFTVTL